MPDNFASNGEGLTMICNGIDPVRKWDSYTATLEDAGLIAPTTGVTGGSSGAGTLNGTYFAYVTYLRNDGFESAMSPISGDFIATNAAQFDYSNVPISPDSRVTGRRIYRNLSGEARTVYLDVEISDNVSTTATSTLSDTILGAGLAFPLFDSRNILLTVSATPPPDTKPFVAFFLGRAYYYGHTDYSEGSCEVAVGSTTVTGRGTRWRSNWAGRFVYIDGADATYEIDSVDVTNQTITLTEPYLGTTNLFAGYTVRPSPAECALLYFSEVGFPEKVSPFNALPVPDDDDVGTGLMPMYGFLYILKQRSIYRFTMGKDPLRDGAMFPANNRGALNQRCAVVVDDKAFILDERGAYLFTGGAEAQSISDKIQDIFQDNTNTPINWAASRFFHAGHSPGEATIRWFLNFRGDYQPRHALCYCYTLQRWWMQFYHRPIGASVVGKSGRVASGWGRNVEQVYYGSDAGEIFGQVQEAPDVVASPVSIGTVVLDAGVNDVTVNAAATSDMVGAPVVHRAYARGILQQRRVVSISGQVLTVHPPWLYTPAADDEIVIGGFPWQFLTSDFRFAASEATTERSFEVFFGGQPGSLMDVEVKQDNVPQVSGCNILAVANYGVQIVKGRKSKRVRLDKKSAFALLKFDGLRENQTDGRRTVAFQVTGCGGNGQDKIDQIVIKGVVS